MAEQMTERGVGARSSRGWQSAAAGAVAAVVVFTLVLWKPPMNEEAVTAFDDLAQLAAAALGGLGAAWAAVRAWRVEQQRLATSWGLIALGCWAWAWGEAIWSLYEVVLKEEVPFPSLADVGFLLLPVLAGLGLALWPTGFVAGRDRFAALLDGMIIGGSLLLISWATALGATVEAGGDTATVVIGAAYPLGDVLMASLVVLLLTRSRRTGPRSCCCRPGWSGWRSRTACSCTRPRPTATPQGPSSTPAGSRASWPSASPAWRWARPRASSRASAGSAAGGGWRSRTCPPRSLSPSSSRA
jgi:hypothetical protein